MNPQLNIVIIGLSITSSWGNGHATTYRALVSELIKRGHQVLFLEHDKPWYAENRDLPEPPYGKTELYQTVGELKRKHLVDVQQADAVIVGSYVPHGVEIGKWVIKEARGMTAFYDIDTPVTLAKMRRNDFEYLHPELIPQYDLYLSFTGGPVLEILETEFHSPKALPLYCSVDPTLYLPQETELKWDLGYLGTYSKDRQPPLSHLMVEAAACGTPIISDYWEGLDTFFEIGSEILISRSPEETLTFLRELDEGERRSIGEKARKKILSKHTAAHRAKELETYLTGIPVPANF